MAQVPTKRMRDEVDFEKRLRQLCAGAGSGAFTKTSIAPLERVKILMQIQGMHSNVSERKYRGILQTMRTVVSEEGPLALFKGNGANVVRIVPTYALKFSFNDTFKDMVRQGGQDKLTFHQLICSGSLAGLFQITMTYPLELVRTRLTLSEGMKQGVRYSGIVDVARQTVRIEGWTALYKGITPTWLSGAPYVGLQMTFFEVFKRNTTSVVQARLTKDTFNSQTTQALLTLTSGACAGVVAQTITYPGDTIRRRMQANGIGGSPRVYSTTLDCIVKSCRREGVLCLYKGLTANTVRCIPGAAIQFWAYDSLKYLLKC